MVFDENRKGGDLLDSSSNQEQLRLKEEDTIVVQTRAPEPYKDSDEDTIVVQLYRPHGGSGSQSPDPPQRSAGISQPGAGKSDEATTKRRGRFRR